MHNDPSMAGLEQQVTDDCSLTENRLVVYTS